MRSWVAAALDAQEGRWALWVPIFALVGAALYMSAAREPWWGWAPLAMSAFVIGAGFAATRQALAWRPVAAVCVCGAALGLGAVAADIKTALVASPKLERTTEPVIVLGWITDVDPGARRSQITVLVHTIENVPRPPLHVRLSVSAPPGPGRFVRCLAILRPPEAPLAPRGYDSARRFYFEKIGATGFALGSCRPTAWVAPPRWWDGLRLKVAAWRRDLTETVLQTSHGQGGAIAAAMITGDRSFLSADTQTAFRDSGLGHLLSVSGLHMALAAGGVYALVHVLLAAIPPVALRFPIRKWAAFIALLSGAAYLVLSGGSVPAQRAFIMTSIALGAVLVDRQAFTMRGLATALAIVVLLQPEAAIDPGMQMSFAATAALIAAFEEPPRAILPTYAPGLLLGGLDRAWKTMSSMLVASVVAGTATDPFALYHFQRVSAYSLASNLAATPIISFVVAPSALAAAALAPFGLAEPALMLMAAALDTVRAIGAVFAQRPEAVHALPLMPDAAFVLTVCALVWACVWRGRVRWAAAAFLIGGLALYATSPRALIWADADLKAVVASDESEDGRRRWFALATGRSDFQRSRLASLAGVAPTALATGPAAANACSDTGCVWITPGGREVHWVSKDTALERACVPGAIVLAQMPAHFKRDCALAFLSTPADRRAYGGFSLTETASGVLVRHVRSPRGGRPWSGALTRSDE
jgi:competence protein ComEC